MERSKVIEDLNSLLRDELSATETYRQAIEKIRDDHGQDPSFQELARMLEDHEQAAAELRDKVRQLGGTESKNSGAWGTWSRTVMGTAKLLGDKAALKALKEGEESGIKDCRSVLDRAPPEVAPLVNSIASRDQAHVQQLDRLIEAA